MGHYIKINMANNVAIDVIYTHTSGYLIIFYYNEALKKTICFYHEWFKNVKKLRTSLDQYLITRRVDIVSLRLTIVDTCTLFSAYLLSPSRL